MKKLLLILLLLIGGCSSYETVSNDCDKPTMFVLVYGSEETYPTAISQLETVKEYHKGNIRKIIYFCNDKQLQDYLDSKYPIIRLDRQVLK